MTHRILLLVAIVLLTAAQGAHAQEGDEGPWAPAYRLDTGFSDQSTDPTVAAGPGDVWFFWEQFDLKRPASIWGMPFGADGGWGQAGPVESDESGNARDPAGAMLPNGQPGVVWEHHDGTRFHTHYARHDAGGGWRPAVRLENHPEGKAHNPQVVVDAQARTLAVWDQPPDGVRVIRSAAADLNGAWQGARDVSSRDAGAAERPRLAVDGTTAMATWLGPDASGDHRAWAARYAFGSNWQAPVLLGEQTAGAPPGVAGAGGTFTIAWAEPGEGVRVAQWPTSGAAAPTVTLAPVGGTLVAGPVVAAHAAGGVIVAWLAEDAAGQRTLTAHLWAEGAWKDVGAPAAGTTGRVQELVTGWAGGAGPVLAWTTSGSPAGVWSSTLEVASGEWDRPTALHAEPATSYENLHASFAADGRGAVAWEQFDGSSRHAWAATRTATPYAGDGGQTQPTTPGPGGPGDGSDEATPGGGSPQPAWPLLMAAAAGALFLTRRGRNPEA